jgi:hypothetical protein
MSNSAYLAPRSSLSALAAAPVHPAPAWRHPRQRYSQNRLGPGRCRLVKLVVEAAEVELRLQKTMVFSKVLVPLIESVSRSGRP